MVKKGQTGRAMEIQIPPFSKAIAGYLFYMFVLAYI